MVSEYVRMHGVEYFIENLACFFVILWGVVLRLEYFWARWSLVSMVSDWATCLHVYVVMYVAGST